METEDIKLNIEVHDYLPNDEETETEKWYTSITSYDVNHEHNTSLCNIIRKVTNDYTALKSYVVSKEMYDLAKEKTKYYYILTLKQKSSPIYIVRNA